MAITMTDPRAAAFSAFSSLKALADAKGVTAFHNDERELLFEAASARLFVEDGASELHEQAVAMLRALPDKRDSWSHDEVERFVDTLDAIGA